MPLQGSCPYKLLPRYGERAFALEAAMSFANLGRDNSVCVYRARDSGVLVAGQ